MLSQSCAFCDELSGQDSLFERLVAQSGQAYNSRVIEASDNFVAVPGLGPISEAYILIIPRDHYIALGSLPNRLLDELESLKAFVWSTLVKRYGSVVAFEHGPAGPALRAGCCVVIGSKLVHPHISCN